MNPVHEIFKWYKQFSERRVKVEDDAPVGRPRSEITDQSIAKTRDMIKSCLKGDHFTSVVEVQAKTENLLKGSPSKNLVSELLPTMSPPNAEVCEC
ncbi:hypothetical protein TNCV_4212371 [Trichonephila clavipes]|nr:hypothetical protein TNCV_4212371 [Trichonephila clavipes]